MDANAGLSTHPWHDELRATLSLAAPLVLSNLTMGLIQATDVVLMGWLGSRQLAAAALGLNLTFAVALVALGLLTATSPMIATALGRRSNAVREVRRTFRQGLWATAIMIVPIWLLMWNAAPVIRALGQEPALAADAALFLKGYMWSMLPWLLFQVMRNFLSAMERPGWILIISAAGILLNALMSWSLIFGHFGLPALGIFGGGLGSSITWTLLTLALGLVLVSDRQFRRFHLFGRWWRADWPRLGRLVRLGLPIGVTMGLEGGVFSGAAYLMGLIDAASIAAHAIALQIAVTSFMVPLGLSQVATVRVGLALGRGDRGGISRAGWTAFALGTGFMAATGLLMLLAPGALVRLFVDGAPGNAQVTALAIKFIGVAAIFQVADGAQVVGAGMLRGLHDTRVPMGFALLGYWLVGLGVGVWLAFYLGWHGVGIWTGLAAGLTTVAVLMLGRWMRREALGLLP
ncbi:MAG: MATE family efflux transporter [Sphingomicrobium sp.]